MRELILGLALCLVAGSIQATETARHLTTADDLTTIEDFRNTTISIYATYTDIENAYLKGWNQGYVVGYEHGCEVTWGIVSPYLSKKDKVKILKELLAGSVR